MEACGGGGGGLVLPHGLHLVCGDVGGFCGVTFESVGACVGGFAVGDALGARLHGLLCGVGGGGGAVDELTHLEVRRTRDEVRRMRGEVRITNYELRIYSSGVWSLESEMRASLTLAAWRRE